MNNMTQREAKEAHARVTRQNGHCDGCKVSGKDAPLLFVRKDGTKSPKPVGLIVQSGTFEALLAEIELSDLLCRICKSYRQYLRKRDQRLGVSLDRWSKPAPEASKRKRDARRISTEQRITRRRDAVNAIKDVAPCVKCGDNGGREEMWIASNDERSIDGYDKSVSNVIANSLSDEQLLAAAFGSDFYCTDCHDALMAARSREAWNRRVSEGGV